MVRPTKTLKKFQHGFTLLEMLAVIGVSSLLLVILASLFRTGLWEVSRSSGRIEVVRNGRNALNQIQRIMSYAMAPSAHYDGSSNQVTTPVYTPLPSEIYDPSQPVASRPAPSSSFRFFTPINILTDDPIPTARQIQDAPQNFAYEIAQVPGNGEGMSVVLRKLSDPVAYSAPDTFPLNIDTGVQPRFLGRRLGLPDSTAPGGFDDAMFIYRLRDSSFQIVINVSSAAISDGANRNRIENATPLQIRMSSIYNPPIYTLD